MSYKCTTHTTQCVTKYRTVLQEVRFEYHSQALNTLQCEMNTYYHFIVYQLTFSFGNSTST